MFPLQMENNKKVNVLARRVKARSLNLKRVAVVRKLVAEG